jgi:glycerol-3-phosphate dehydrogenase
MVRGNVRPGIEARTALSEGVMDEADLLDRRTRIGLDPAARERAVPAARETLLRAHW